jgi:hypothetical protein
LSVSEERKMRAARQGARPTLEKIIGHFPGMAFAGLAQSRPAHLKLEIKGQKENAGHEARRL